MYDSAYGLSAGGAKLKLKLNLFRYKRILASMPAKLQLSGGMHDRIRVVDVELSPTSSFHPFYSWTSRGPGSCGSPEGKGRIGECFKLKLHQCTLYDFPTVLSIMTNNILLLYTIPVNAVINAGRLTL